MEERIMEEKNTKKGMNKFLLIGSVIIVFVVLTGVFFVGYSMINSDNKDDKIVMGPVFESNEFTVNLREAGGRR